MAPPTKKAPSAAAAAAAAAAAPTQEEDNYNSSELNWLQNPHSPTTSSTTTDDPALVPLLSSLKELDFNLTCPICRSAPLRIPVTLTTCPHAFCATCLQSNLQHQSMAKNGTRTDRTCPVCRVRCSEGDVRGSAVLEGVCAAWRAVRGEVLERVWSSSSSGAGGGTGNPAAAADGGGSGSDAAAAAAAAQDGGGGKKRAASASSSSDTGGRKKRPRRRRGGERSRATAAAAAGNNATDNDDDDSPSSGEEYVDDESDADSDVEFVPKSGGGGGDGGSDGGGKKKAKKYPTDEEFLDRTLDRSHPIPGNVGSMKKPQLVRLLESYRLSTSGNSLDVLRDRYRQFRMLYNAECHRQSTEPAPVAQLVANVQADELARKQERGLAIMNGSSRDAEVMKNLNAKWTRDANANADADANTRTNDDGGKKSRADDIPDKMKSKFAELVAEGTKRWKEQGNRMEQKRWGEEDHERAIQQEEKNGGDEGEEPIVLDDGSDDDGLDERKPSAVVAAALEETAEDAAVDEPLDSARAHAEAGAAASSPDGGDDEAEAQISRSPSSESPRTVRASSSSDGLVGSAPASALASSTSALAWEVSSTSASASEASSAKRSRPSPQQPSQRHSPPSHYQHHQQSPPVESAGQQRGSVDTRSTRNNTPSTIGPWSCPLCTYDNKTNIGSRDKCEVCDGPRPTNRRPSRNVATFDC